MGDFFGSIPEEKPYTILNGFCKYLAEKVDEHFENIWSEQMKRDLTVFLVVNVLWDLFPTSALLPGQRMSRLDFINKADISAFEILNRSLHSAE